MHTAVSRNALFVLWMLTATGSTITAQTGTVEGFVEGASGTRIEAARVTLAPGVDQEYRERRVVSDDQGHFVFQDVPSGEFLIYARKEEAGFSDVRFLFFSIGQPRPQEIKVSGGTTRVVLKVGEPDGKLSCEIEDESGRPVAGAQYRLLSSENPAILIISGADRKGQIDTPVPAVPIILQVEATGFHVWRSEVLLIKTGEAKRLVIKLTALTKYS